MRTAVVIFLFVFSGLLHAGDRRDLVADETSQSIQNARADTAKLSRMRNVAMIERFARHGYLVPVSLQTRHYYLHAIPPAQRYCRPWTKLFLERLSSQFYARFNEPLRVTSLVRTVGSQRRLAQRNENAAEASGALRSSHLTGATLDISKRGMSPQEQDWVRDVLFHLREQHYIYAIEEFRQPTFHVMVYPNYPRYVDRLRKSSRSVEVADSGSAEPPAGD